MPTLCPGRPCNISLRKASVSSLVRSLLLLSRPMMTVFTSRSSTARAIVSRVKPFSRRFARFAFLPAPGRLPPCCFLIGVESVSGGFPVALQPHQLVLICSSLCNPCATRSSSSLFFIHLQVTAAQLRHRSPYNHSRKVSKMEHRHYEVCRTSLDCTQRR